ncbi:MAG: O-antigen ligase family protein [Candidatus Manganitrophus sp.]|nr:O-antigen ligase family protein [Candidatus Manganitrophus sp.]MDC4226039.1 O-antigen ligase family protein [Candidatus Manganitrophus sp.]WDT72705.1 MAG: O-antigen ligase family protein [Candidatus Manganitrophus sp.]
MLFAWFRLPINKFKSALIVLFISLGMLYFAPQSFWDEMSTFSESTERGSGAARVFFWKVAVEQFIDHPIIGVGINNYGVWLPEYAGTRVEFDDTIFGGVTKAYGRVNHSLYFTLLSELGSIGVLLFTTMLYQFYKELRFDRKIVDASAAEKLRNCRNLSMALLGGMIGFLVSGAFITVLYYPYFWLMCSLAVALGNCKRKILKETAAMPDRGLSLSMKKIQ